MAEGGSGSAILLAQEGFSMRVEQFLVVGCSSGAFYELEGDFLRVKQVFLAGASARLRLGQRRLFPWPYCIR